MNPLDLSIPIPPDRLEPATPEWDALVLSRIGTGPGAQVVCRRQMHLPGETTYSVHHVGCTWVPPRGVGAGQRSQPKRKGRR